ncbi:MAG: hypothetical protein IJ746_03145 [Ruminococcus sp.]|nr:hypothetical protein [Ruminococcus sp.]
MGFIIIGLILIGIGVYFAVFSRGKKAGLAMEMQATATSTVAEAKEAIEAMADYNPDYREFVELKGTAITHEQVKTPYTNKPVAYYAAETLQVSETTEERRDSNGNRRMSTTKHEDKLSDEESSTDLILKDSSGGEIVIETNGISNKLDLIKSYDHMDMTDPYANTGNLSIRRRYRRYNAPHYNGVGYRVLGYRKIEQIIPLNAALYVLGEAYMMAGKLYIGPPKDSKKPFIVTTKSEDQMLQQTQSSQRSSLIGGIVCCALGVILAIVGITKL